MRRICICLLLMWLLVRLPVRAAAGELRMNVLEPGIRSASVSFDQSHKWYIRYTFPKAVDTSGQYTLLQTLPSGLTYIPGSLEVCVLKTTGEVIPLIMGKDFCLTAGAVVTEEGISDRISITLTQTGCDHLPDGGELRIAYLAGINENGSMGTQLVGTAQLNYLDEEGNRSVLLSEKAAVSTGGFHIQLTDMSGSPLSGGEFMVARAATPEELEEKALTIELLDTGEKTIAVVYEPFCPSEDLREETAYTAKTDQEGKTVCCGLAYGEYYLVQTKAGKGADLPAKPVKVTVNEASHITANDGWKDSSGRIADHTVRIVNGSMELPMTGDPGIYGYSTMGILVILSACLLLWYNRKTSLA